MGLNQFPTFQIQPTELSLDLIYPGTQRQGIKAVHANKTVHRDLKPANIMRKNGGLIVIVDFGIHHLSSPCKMQGRVSIVGVAATWHSVAMHTLRTLL